jgi:LmbE family N-acetylglucosaminyl deacetylase
MRSLTRWLARTLQRGLMREWPRDHLRRSAVVFAPHPDDETLGCGGTIIHKKRAGADVAIVFMTDGSQSHAGLMAPDELCALRAREAVAAGEVLGVGRADLLFLDLPDGRLSQNEACGAEKVADLLRRRRPEQVFIPYHDDGPSDHLAANRIVQRALQACGHTATVLEYPVWFWYHWPWKRLEGRGRAGVGEVRDGLAATWRLCRDFRCRVSVRDILDLKRKALEQHRSQVERLVPNPSWETLGDVAGGDFLRCFFQEWEIFHRPRPGKSSA